MSHSFPETACEEKTKRIRPILGENNREDIPERIMLKTQAGSSEHDGVHTGPIFTFIVRRLFVSWTLYLRRKSHRADVGW